MKKIKLKKQKGKYRLAIGCGDFTLDKDDWIGLDQGDYGQDIVWDLRHGIPLPDNSCKEIFADQVLEHIQLNEDFILVMNECLRVLENNGEMEIRVPYWKAQTAYKDPTHSRYFDPKTFTFLEPTNKWLYGFDKRWQVLTSKVEGDSQVHCILKAIKK